jgi:hypothetical protein
VRRGRSGRQNGIVPLSFLPQTSNNIIQKGLAFVRKQSGTVPVRGAQRVLGILPRRLHRRGGAVVVAANDAATNAMEDPDVKTHQYSTGHFVRGLAAQ